MYPNCILNIRYSIVLRMASASVALWVGGIYSAAFESVELTIDHPNVDTVSLFAENPDIVTPTGIAVAPDGRVFVQENHTHQRPETYVGPAKDRILVFEDSDGDGVADRRLVFHEGLEFTTDLLFASDGALYATTRSDVFRFPDAANLAKATGDPERIVHCDTESVYPHDGVSGLAIDPGDPDWLYFGFGENLGFDYTFIGADGVRISGGNEGGSTYRCRLDGSRLERLSTGHWNPFGMSFDLRGNLFATDNDPSSTPPNRLLHVVKGADFGFEMRYGRSGRHPLVTWTGDNPGTLGMVSGVGEAACGIIPFGPGQMLVASWGDNRIYLHTLEENGRSFTASRENFLSGSNQFRPVHFAYDDEATILYISDWGLWDYPVHGKGRIWRVALKSPVDLAPRPRKQLPEMTYELALADLGSSDPYARNEAVRVVARDPREDWRTIKDPVARAHYAVALRRSQRLDASENLPGLLDDSSEEVSFVAIKWISDERLDEYRSDLMRQLNRPDLSRKLMLAIFAAEQRLDGRKPSDLPTSAQLGTVLDDPSKPSRLRALALSLIPARDVAVAKLVGWTQADSAELRFEAVRSLAELDTRESQEALVLIANDERQSPLIRAEAVLGLAANPEATREHLERLARGANTIVASEARRALAAAGFMARDLRPKPNPEDVDDWVSMIDALNGSPDPDTGRRVFFHPRLATCANCHQFEGRGIRVGPDLTTIHRQEGVDSRWLLTHILNPAETIAPQYLPWQVSLKNGDTKMGFVMRKGGNREAYLGIDGKEFIIPKSQIVQSRELPITLMPPGLLAPLQPEEIRDLIAFLLRE